MRLIPLAVLSALLAGCGYSTGLHLDQEYSSLGVELFGNDSPTRDLERELHSALTRVVRDRVSAPLLAPADADLVIRGTILDVHFRSGIRSRENELLETGLSIRAQAALWDPNRAERVAGPVQAQAQVGYALDAPFGEAEALRRVLDNLAERLVLELLTAPQAHEQTEAPPEVLKR